MLKGKTILLLGGSFQQLVAIRKAKELGLRTVLCDYLPDNPGQYEVDKFYNVSTTDVDAVYGVAKKENVDGILAYASDPAALPAAIVCERLGLPTNPVKSIEILGIKYKFREFLQNNGFACPKTYTFSPDTSLNDIKEAVANFTFPIVIKPTDSSGSKGVSFLDTTDGIEKAIQWADSYSRNKTLIAEEFIQRGFPFVVGGEIFVEDGKIVVWGEMSCLRGNLGQGLIPIGKKKPSGLNEFQTAQVHHELQRIIEALGIKNGELNIEILLDKNDNVHFLELGPRAGGNMLPIQISDALDIDLVKANVLAAMGEPVNLNPKEKEGCFVSYVLHSYENGIFDSIEYAPGLEERVYRYVPYKQKGDKVETFDGAGKACGIVFLHFDTVEEMEGFTSNCEQFIKVKLL